MERPDSLLSVVTGWLVAASLAAKFFYDWVTAKSAARKTSAEAIKAETDREETVFARAYRQLEDQEADLKELRIEIKELRAEVRRLTVIEDQAIRESLAHDREAAAWKILEADLRAQIEHLTHPQA